MKLLPFATLPCLALACALPLAAQSPTPAAPAQDHHDQMAMDKAPVPPSHSVNISFQGHVTTLTMEDLLKLPQTTVHVHNAHNNQDETYTGPLLSDLLGRAGLTFSKETEPVILHSAIVATGTDRYFVLYSGAEAMPAFSKSQVIVAVMKSGLPDTAGGNIQLINTDGARPARWVHGLLDVNVITLTAKFSPPAGQPAAAPTAKPEPPSQPQ